MTSLPDIFAEVPLLDASIHNNTQMTGPLPESIGKNAVSINIEGNHFTGTVPDSWARLGLGLVIRRENYLSEYIPDSYVRAADASFLINSYLGLAKFRETPMVAGDYDIPAYLPKKDYKDIMTGKSIPFQQIASKNKVTVLLTLATWCPNSAALIPILKRCMTNTTKTAWRSLPLSIRRRKNIVEASFSRFSGTGICKRGIILTNLKCQ
jgi:hypothetical protein